MNYLQEILNFEKLQELNQVSPGQARLWYVLMYINNLTGWKTWFTVANSTLEFRSRLSRSGINRARNELKQLGYIDFKSNGRKATSYRMIPLMQYSTQDSVQSSVQTSTQRSTQTGVQSSVQTSSTLYKQNKTKQNKSIVRDSTPDLSPVFDLWQSNWGFPNSVAQQDLNEWVREFGIELVKYAIECALKRNVSARGADGYLDRTFQAYRQKGIKNVEDATAEAQRYQQQFNREHANSGGHQHIEEPLPDWAKKADKPKKRPSKEFFESLYDEG